MARMMHFPIAAPRVRVDWKQPRGCPGTLLQITDAQFDRATQAAQNPAQSAAASTRTDSQVMRAIKENRSEIPSDAKSCKYLLNSQLGAVGFEPTKAEPPDLQSGPFGHFGTRPN